MKGAEKAKAQKIVDRLQQGDFDENDVDNLFMRLRAFSMGYRVFREMADFVAHNEERDRGLTNQSLEAFYLSFRYFVEYVSPKKTLDIGQPFPLYIKRLMSYQLDKCKESDLRSQFNVTRQRLRARIDNLFQEDRRSGTAVLRRSTIGADTLGALRHLLGFIGSHPAFSDAELIDELIGVLRQNALVFDEAALRTRAPAVTLCAMLLLHNSRFSFGGVEPGTCSVSCEVPSVPLGVIVGGKAPEKLISDQYGRLQVSGTVTVESEKSAVKISYPVFMSSLLAHEHCAESLFTVEVVEPKHLSFYFGRVAFDQELCLGSDFKLAPTNAQQVVQADGALLPGAAAGWPP